MIPPLAGAERESVESRREESCFERCVLCVAKRKEECFVSFDRVLGTFRSDVMFNLTCCGNECRPPGAPWTLGSSARMIRKGTWMSLFWHHEGWPATWLSARNLVPRILLVPLVGVTYS